MIFQNCLSNFTRLMAREITHNNFETWLVVFMPNIATNHALPILITRDVYNDKKINNDTKAKQNCHFRSIRIDM